MVVNSYVVCILHNMGTDRPHNILFRPAPFPGNVTDLMRHRSAGHHTAGFDTIEAAVADAKALAERVGGVYVEDSGFAWDGEDIPAMTAIFNMDADGKVSIVL